jgi:GH15 family glucan-1,4-alpha-glucosidase
MAISTGDLIARRSVDVLKQGQSASGAFVASPSFPTYHYAWLRDGAFCAHALDLVGECEAARAFHEWAARSVEVHRSMVEGAIAEVGAGRTPPPEAMPPARFTLDGSLERSEDEPWPNFQPDGYGMWLWALAAHLDGDVLPDGWAGTVELVARYLQATWRLKCFSCWEELDGGEHASTLGAVAAGLTAAARLLDDEQWAAEADRAKAGLLDRFVHGGRFGRGPADQRLDGSLLWLAVPFAVLPLNDPRIAATVAAVQRELVGPTGGVYRYRGDTYYGGGEWVLLACSLGWHAALAGDREAVTRARGWVRAQAGANGDLPEQITTAAQAPDMVEPWLQRWGPVATPLLWSHAMYLIMEHAAGG